MTILQSILLTLLLIAVFILTQLGFGLIVYKTDLIPEYLHKHVGITTLLSFVISYLLMIKLFWRSKPNFRKVITFNAVEFNLLPHIMIIAIGLQLLAKPFWDLNKIWDYFYHSEFISDNNVFEGFRPAFFYGMIITLIISPIFEELFFRKFLLSELLKQNSKKIGIIISSLCFAFIHIETPLNLIPTFIFGVISSLIFLKTKNISYSIILHFLLNLSRQILQVADYSFNRWLLSLNFNYMYWIFFVIGIGFTYFGVKKILAAKAF